MADKHDLNPGRVSAGRYRKVVELGSASSWDAFTLAQFRVEFDRHAFHPLPDVVLKYTPLELTEAPIEAEDKRDKHGYLAPAYSRNQGSA